LALKELIALMGDMYIAYTYEHSLTFSISVSISALLVGTGDIARQLSEIIKVLGLSDKIIQGL